MLKSARLINITLSSALLSAFLRSCNTNSADFSGHLPWQAPHCFNFISLILNLNNMFSRLREKVFILIYLGFTADAAVKSLEWHNFLMFHNVFQVFDRASDWHIFDGIAHFASVLEVNAQVRATALD